MSSDPSIIQPHIIDRDPTKRPSHEEMKEAIVSVACMVLLFEKENETVVRTCLASLAQERHNQYHTKEGDRKNGDGTSFQDCGNEVCIEVNRVLEAFKKPAVEFNQLTAEMMLEKYDLHIAKSAGNDRVLVALKERGKINEPPPIPDLPDQGLKIKV